MIALSVTFSKKSFKICVGENVHQILGFHGFLFGKGLRHSYKTKYKKTHCLHHADFENPSKLVYWVSSTNVLKKITTASLVRNVVMECPL